MDILPNPKSLKTFIENLRCACQFAPVLNVIPEKIRCDAILCRAYCWLTNTQYGA